MRMEREVQGCGFRGCMYVLIVGVFMALNVRKQPRQEMQHTNPCC